MALQSALRLAQIDLQEIELSRQVAGIARAFIPKYVPAEEAQ